jgi:ferric-dicitrate binding protein FerR (iron transport regulator)
VKEGKVAVYAADSEENATILLPGDLLRLHSGTEAQLKVAGRNYLSWKTNELIFENTSLDKVVRQVADFYDVKIRTEKSIADYRLTARFKDKTLEETLEVIKTIFDVEVRKNDEFIFLSANSPPKDETKKK